MSRDAQASCRSVPPFILNNKYIQPFGISNPKYHCYMNSVTQLLFSILITIIYIFTFNSSTEGSLSKCLFETGYSASRLTDMNALKFQLVKYDIFYGGQIQQDGSECCMMQDSVPHCGSNDNHSTEVTLSQILFSFMFEKYMRCM